MIKYAYQTFWYYDNQFQLNLRLLAPNEAVTLAGCGPDVLLNYEKLEQSLDCDA